MDQWINSLIQEEASSDVDFTQSFTCLTVVKVGHFVSGLILLGKVVELHGAMVQEGSSRPSRQACCVTRMLQQVTL